MSKLLKKIVIVGGGFAGWLSAGIIAAEHSPDTSAGIEVTVSGSLASRLAPY